MRRSAGALHVLLGLSLALPARAADAPPRSAPQTAPAHPSLPEREAPAGLRASDAFAEGLRRVQAGEYSAAKAAFLLAYELEPHPVVLYNVGQCEARLGQWQPAIATLARFLREGDTSIDAAQREAVARQLDELRSRAGRAAEAPPMVAAVTPAPSPPATWQLLESTDAPMVTLAIGARADTSNSWAWWVGGGGVVLLGSAAALYLWNDGRYVDWRTERGELRGMDLAQDPVLWDRANQNNERLASIERIDVLTAVVSVVGAAGLGLGIWQLAAAGDSGKTKAQPASASAIGLRTTW